MKSVVVIDYGVVNLKNIFRGFEYVGAQVEISNDPDRVVKGDRVILPGVGAFESGINELRATGLDEAVKLVASAGRPILGICLGMQMLLDSSTEYGSLELRHDVPCKKFEAVKHLLSWCPIYCLY